MFAATTPSEAQLKTQARLLKTFLADKGTPLSHTTCLEAVATIHGHKSWHHAQAACLQQLHLQQTDPAVEHEVDVLLQTLHAQLDARICPQVLRRTGVSPTVTAYSASGDADNAIDVTREYVVQLSDGSRLVTCIVSTFTLRYQTLILESTLHVTRTWAGHGEPDELGHREGASEHDLMEEVDTGSPSFHMQSEHLFRELARHVSRWPDACLTDMLTDVMQ